jgi:predicted ArsR family transcriptional regulator
LKQTWFVQTLGRSRSRVLDELRAAAEPIGVVELAGRIGLHPNTARFHLDALVADGLGRRATESLGRVGRPRTLYAAVPGSPGTGRRSYQVLAEILAGHLAAHTRRPAESAAQAGREWGRHLARRPLPFQRTTAEAALEQLLDVLADAGFEPSTPVGRREIRLQHCPFREIADRHGEVVCSVHVGIMQGLLAELGAPLRVQGAERFAAESGCRVRLARGRAT